MTEDPYDIRKTLPNELMADYYAQRASITGLIITEGAQISPELAAGWMFAPKICSEQHDANAWKVVVDAVHEKGGKIFCQLWHMLRPNI